jgi:hypothetical protein
MSGPPYDDVRRKLADFLGALSTQDQVWLYTFDIVPARVYAGPVTSVDQIMAALPDQIAQGRSTDIGAALDRAVEVLKDEATAPIAAVVLLTDGVDEPAAGSHYPSVNDPAWDVLRQRAEQVSQGRSVSAFAVALDEDRTAGAQLLLKIFAQAEMLNPAQTGAASYLDRPKEAVRDAKARLALAPDAAGTVTVTWPDHPIDLRSGQSTFDVVLHSTMTRIPLVVTNLSISATGVGAPRLELVNGPVALAPGASATVAVRVSWSPPSPCCGVGGQVSQGYRFALAAAIDSPWRDVLTQDLTVPLRPTLSGSSTELTLVADGNSSLVYLLGLGAVVLVALIVALLVRSRTRPRMSGTLVVRSSHATEPIATVKLSGRSRRLGPPDLPQGRGVVHGTRSADRRGVTAPAVRIIYSGDGSRALRVTSSIHYGQSGQVGAFFFEHVPRHDND